MRVLVVFDTKHGTTEEVAGRVADAIVARGGKSELLDLRKRGAAGTPLAGYDAVALGGPFYMGSWSKRVRAFAAAREADLAGKKLGIFAIGSDTKLGEAAALSTLPVGLAVDISASAYFGGRFDFDRLGSFERFIVKTVGGTTESSSTLDLSKAEPFAASLMGQAGAR